MNNNTEYIARYLQNDITDEERIVFEKQLAVDKDLQQEFFIQQQIIKAAETSGLKNEFGKAIRKRVINHHLVQWGIAAVILVGTFILFTIIKDFFSRHTANTTSERTEEFMISNAADTIIETRDGVVFAIPANAFNSSSNTVRLEIKTALNGYDIMRQGLSTVSNDALLQTAGMFYINGYEGDKPVPLVKNINVSVPANEINPAMQLFNGVEDSNGHVNWVNPKPVNKDLLTYDITTLDFYPPDYIPALKALQKDYTNKEYTDSLYYSFSSFSSPDVAAGKTLFMSKCASCHNIFKESTGPALQHLEDRGKWSDHNEILKWVHNPAAYMANDPYTQGLKARVGSMMTGFAELTIKDVDNIVAYINDEVKKKESSSGYPYSQDRADTANKPGNIGDTAGRPIIYDLTTDSSKKIDTLRAEYYHPELDPARIRTIWNEKFNNSILATKEFEERLRYMHGLCTPVYFETYFQNLNKPLYEIDQRCADMSSGDVRRKFLEFAARKDGGVRIKDGLQEKLSDYFQKKYKAYQQAAKKTRQKYEAELNQLDQIADDKKRKQATKDFIREDKNFQKEFCANLTDAYKQIGVARSCTGTVLPPPPAYYNIVISTTGWKNLDMYVFDATTNRQSMSYTDPVSGKTATLTYKDVNITIVNLVDYDKVFVYLIPDSLSSFQRMEQQGSIFKESLNSLFHYDAIAIAFKGSQKYFYRRTNLQAGDHSFSLLVAGDEELKQMMKGYSRQKSKELITEIEYRLFEQEEVVRQVQLNKDREFREQIADIIFACGEEGPRNYPESPQQTPQK